METLYLIDGHSLAYRMYYADVDRKTKMPTLTSRSGEYTGAVFNFTRKLLDIIERDMPDYIAVCFDASEVTFRNELYEEYKSNREAMPEPLREQIRRIRQMLAAFNIPMLEHENYEADDLLGTVSRLAAEQGVKTRIITGDSDMLQLDDEWVTVEQFIPFKPEWVYDSPAKVRERYGVAPDRLVEYKALVGDTSDNVPGVHGIGEKLALELFEQFDSLDAMLANLDEISGTRARNALEKGQETARLSYELVCIKRDVDIDFQLETCRTREFDLAPVINLMEELEFRSLLDRIKAAVEEPSEGDQLSMFGQMFADNIPDDFDFAPGVAKPDTVLHLVTTTEDLDRLADVLASAGQIAFDTETTSVDQMAADLVGISLAVVSGEAYYIPVGHQSGKQLALGQVLDRIRPAMTDPNIPKVAHNAKYDAVILSRHGLDVYPLSFDTMIAEWLVDPAQSVGLKETVDRRLDVTMTEITELLGTGRKQITMDAVDVQQAEPYAAADADYTLRLVEPLRADMRERSVHELFTELEMPLVPILARMERTGILVDVNLLAQMSKAMANQLNDLSATIYRIAGQEFNINSPQQLSEILFGTLGLPKQGVRKTKSGYYSTAASVLDSLVEHDTTGFIDTLLQYRSLEKLRSTYLDALPALVNPETGRIHTSFNQTGTVTGRLSSSSPNLQNIPIRTEEGRRIRDAFIARPGWVLIAADYSQVELRILAHMADDDQLKEAFVQNQDIHTTTADTVYDIALDQVTPAQRSFAKSVNYGLLYGMGAFRLARDSVMEKHDAQAFIDTYFERFPKIRGFLDEPREHAIEKGYVETLLGRKRYFAVFDSDESGHRASIARRAAEREAVNMPIQGTAADIIKLAMLNLETALRKEGLRGQMLLQVHDELVLEVPREEADATLELTQEIMESAYTLSVPLKVDAHQGPNWGQLK
ncbi:MAG: DNA polymerase I [Anaerolineae bacterium]